ncbi:MAG: sigma-70 family RNA polymerase sigma factor [Bryobacteraceae bacterium]|nr:sigma-70 family RNA polymerase sigma factor [Bryobacteraceae bacterium]MDW8379101.1 sigma-70 family RNA polymerase sigma factor [Bryobacterales bacterium]
MKPELNNLSSLGDDQLVVLAQGGYDPAFAELIRRHQSSCLKLAMSILRDRSDAEDEVQNAFWKAFEHLGQFQRDARFSTWLTRIVVNQCLMRLRQTRRAKFLYLDDAMIGDEVGTLELPAPEQTPEQELGKQEVANLLRKEIRRIPPLLRNVFLLRDVQQLPMPDVAKQLGISVAAAKSRLLRARLELRSRLAKHQGRLGPATLTA